MWVQPEHLESMLWETTKCQLVSSKNELVRTDLMKAVMVVTVKRDSAVEEGPLDGGPWARGSKAEWDTRDSWLRSLWLPVTVGKYFSPPVQAQIWNTWPSSLWCYLEGYEVFRR